MPTNDPNRLRIWGALASIYFIWGSTYLGIRILALEDMPPLLTAGARFMAAGVILWVFAGKERRSQVRPIHLRSGLIVGGALLLGGNGGVVLAEVTVTSGIAALMIAATPMWFALFSLVFLKERVSRLGLAGLVLGFIGIAYLSLGSQAESASAFGIGALILAPIFWAGGSLYSRQAPLPESPTVAIALEMMLGATLQIIAGLIIGEGGRVGEAQLNTESITAFIYLVLIGSLVGFTCYIWLLKKAPTSLVATYAYVNPVVAVGLGALFLDESLSLKAGISALVIIIAVAMVVSATSRAGKGVAVAEPTGTPPEGPLHAETSRSGG